MSTSIASVDEIGIQSEKQNSEVDDTSINTNNEGFTKPISCHNKSISDQTIKQNFTKRTNFWRLSQLFSMAKQNSSTTSQDVNITAKQHQSSQQLFTSNLGLNSFQQISSSATSGFLQQKIAQPLTALLKQKSEHKNSITQFFIHFKGPDWRAEQLQYQMPAHDLQMLKTQSTEVKFVRNQQRKAQIKPQLFLNKSTNFCFKCQKQLDVGSYGVKISVTNNGNNNNGYNTTTDDEDSSALKTSPIDSTQPTLNGSTALYHVECFTCEECGEILVDLKAFLYNNPISDLSETSKVNYSLYCFRHFVELYKPRCQYCDHLIFDEECTEAEGKAWHIGHFCCTECKRSLGGQQYIMANPNKQTDKKELFDTKNQILEQHRQKQQLPYCLTCFDIRFGELCEECGELIGCDVGAICHEGRSWHARDLCFKCNMCSKALLGKPFLPAFDGKIYCSLSCSKDAIHRNRYRDRKKPKQVTDNNDLSKKLVKQQHIDETAGQRLSQNKPKIDQIIHNGMKSENDVIRNGIKESIDYNEPSIPGIIHEIRDKRLPNNTDFEKLRDNSNCFTQQSLNSGPNIEQLNQSLANHFITEQMLEYIQNVQQSNERPNYLMEYMREQLMKKQLNPNDLIGASIEYGSSLSEDERTNQHIYDNQLINTLPKSESSYTQRTSSNSSSLNTAPAFDLNNFMINNPSKYRQLVSHSSSSNETTPLLVRPQIPNDRLLEERSKQLAQTHNPSHPYVNISDAFPDHCIKKSDSPSQTSQADHSSNSSFNENINKSNSFLNKKLIESKNPEVDTPSTQSTAIQSTSSQTTPETNPRSPNKSVTFDPNVKEPTGRKLNRKYGHSKSKPSRNWSDNHSCSTCSTCSSSSSSSDGDYDYESVVDRKRNQWLGGTKIHYVSNDRKKNISNLVQDNASQRDESCTIS